MHDKNSSSPSDRRRHMSFSRTHAILISKKEHKGYRVGSKTLPTRKKVRRALHTLIKLSSRARCPEQDPGRHEQRRDQRRLAQPTTQRTERTSHNTSEQGKQLDFWKTGCIWASGMTIGLKVQSGTISDVDHCCRGGKDREQIRNETKQGSNMA